MEPTQPVQLIADRFPALEEREILLAFYAPEAEVVQVAGTFNGWCPEANPMQRAGSGEWTVRLGLKAGRYEYRFVADGIWADEPDERQRVPNPYGRHNSVLEVALDDRTELL
jgi:1,4-alpha-glucan branching enzyme